MAESPEMFAQLLTDAIWKIKKIEKSKIGVIQDELGYALGKNGGASIEYWRKRQAVPTRWQDTWTLARQLVKRGDMNAEWLQNFLNAAGFPSSEKLVATLFPDASHPSTRLTNWTAELPEEEIPEIAPLVAVSKMPLRPNRFFVGRTRQLRQLAKNLNHSRVAAVNQVPVAATAGMGGIGKTQLASEFVHRYGQYFAGGVFWLNFEDATTVPMQIAELGGPSGLDLSSRFWTLPVDERVRMVQTAWQASIPRLLVFDNCEDEALFEEWIPTTGGCRVLVTTRRGEWDAVLNVQLLQLNVLNRQESIELLRNQSGITDNDLALEKIARELGDLPLALHLAGKYLRRHRGVYSPADYLTKLQSPDLLTHSSMNRSGVSPTRHVQHVGKTFALSFDQLAEPRPDNDIARKLLIHAAHFAPGEPIWNELLIKTVFEGAISAEKRELATAGFARLVELGLIERREQHVLTLHRLVASFVQQVARDEIDATLERIQRIVFAETERANQTGQPMPLLAWHIHLQRVAEETLTREDDHTPRLFFAMGEHMRQLGKFNDALNYFERALTIWKKIPNHDLPIANCHHWMGHCWREKHVLAHAKEHLTQALQIRQSLLGTNHIQTARTYDEFGKLSARTGDYADAEQKFKSALEIAKKTIGLEHAFTADFLNNYGMSLNLLGKRKQGLQYIQQALDVRRRVLGENHARTALSFNNVGLLLQDIGHLDEAFKNHCAAYQIRKVVLSNVHPDTAESLNNLGNTLINMGRLDEAESYVKKALHSFETIFGFEHTNLAFPLINLGNIFRRRGDLPTAQSYYQRAYEIRYNALGESHPATKRVLAKISSTTEAAES